MNFAAFIAKLSDRAFGRVSVHMPMLGLQNRSPWHALPGNRIELGDTGFAIELRTKPIDVAYQLFDPEGRHIARAAELQPLKSYGEKLARERDEFKL